MTNRSPESIKLLHVDDEPGFSAMIKDFLEQSEIDIDVISATGVDEGLNYLSQTKIDCIISDYEMPTKNGLAFLKTVRENHGDLPFILYTGKGSEEIASEAISTGVTDYMQKGVIQTTTLFSASE